MVEIKNGRDLESWLQDRPREDAFAIAARAALRVAPLLVTALDTDAEARRATIILPSLRALAASWVAAVGPTQGAEVRNATARAADAATYAAAQPTAHVAPAVNAARAATNAANASAYAPRAAYATHAAGNAVDAISWVVVHDALAADPQTVTPQVHAAASSAVWDVVSFDATALEEGQLPAHLAATRLWPEEPPSWLLAAHNQLRDHLLGAFEGWEVWTDWYEARLNGRPFNKPLEEARVLIDPDFWDQGPKAVNAEIARLIAEHTNTFAEAVGTASGRGSAQATGETLAGGHGEQRLPPLRQSGSGGPSADNRGEQLFEPFRNNRGAPLPGLENAGRQSAAGYGFAGSLNGQIELIDSSQGGQARDDEIGREFHGEVRSAALEVQDRCKRSNQLYALGEAIRKYLERLGNDPSEVKRTLILYGEVLRNLRDADLRLQVVSDPLPEPIPEDAFAALQTLIAAHNQYVGTDPALASLQRALSDPEEVASVVVKPDETLEALDDYSPVLGDTAQEALRDAAEAAKPDTPTGRRALVWLDQSWRNLAIETSRRVLFALRKSAEAFYDETVIAARLTTEQAIEAARETAVLALRRAKQGAVGYVAIEAGPGAIEALTNFAARNDVVGRVVRTGETIVGAGAITLGGGIGLIVLLAIVSKLLGRSWFRDLIENPKVKEVFDLLKP